MTKSVHRRQWKKSNKIRFSRPYGGNDLPSEMIALEPRVMLDGAAAVAAVAEAAEPVDQNAGNGTADNAEPVAQAANSGSDNSGNSGDNSESADAGQAGPAASQSLIIIDASVADAQTLLTGVDPSAHVFYLNAGTDGIQQITNILAGLSNVTDLHILSHGSSGSVTLGATTLDASNIESYASQFVDWDVALADGGDILLYGCNVGQDDAGMDFIDLFSELTNADVAASSDITASSAMGGDWDLEVATGSIEASRPLDGAAAEAYGFKLAIPIVTSFTRETPVTSPTTPTNADTLTFLATFSEDVTNVDLTDFAVTGTTATVTGVTQVTASSYQVTVSGGDLAGLNGMVGLDLAAVPSINALAGGAALVNAEPATDETYLLDNTAPGAPSIPDLLSGSDSGASPVDDITSDTTPTLTGTGEVGATIRIFSQLQGQVGTVTVNAGNTWTVTTDILADGIHNLSATATDAAGNVSGPSIPLTATIDTSIIPSSTPDLLTASDTGSSGTDDITANTTPTFTGTAEAGTPAGATVTITSSLGGTLGTTLADGAGNWSFTSGALAEGVHQITSTSVDAAGNTHAASAPLTVTIDTTAPGAPSTPDLDTVSDTGSSNTDDNTADNTPTLTGTSEPNATVTVISSIAGTLGAATADGAGAWSFTALALANGTHILTATATDIAGNTSVASGGLTVVVDTATPAAPSTPDLLAASDSGTLNNDDVTNDATPTLTGTAEAGATIEVFAGMTSLGTTIAGGGTWSFTPMAALGDGAHSITATATDAAGNVSAASGALNIVIDTIAPAMAGTPDLFTNNDSGISNSDDITSDNTPALLGTAEPNSIVELFDGAFRLGQVNASNAGVWAGQLQLAADGVHVYTARATDLAGNVGAPSAGLSVTIDTVALAPAGLDLIAASDTGSSDTDDITSLTTPTITGTAEAGAAITLTSNLDGAAGTTTADGSGNWTITTVALSENTHDLTATQTDLAGNGSPASAALTVIIDRTAPALTSFTRGNPAVSPTNVDSLQFIATFNEAVANVSASDFAVTGTTATVTSVVQLANPLTYQITVSGGDLANLEGTVGLDLAGAAMITDLAGNALPAGEPATDETYTIDNTAPTLLSFTQFSPATSPTNSDTLFFRAIFSEDVTNVGTADFAVNSTTTATVTGLATVSGSIYNLFISGGDLAGFDGTVNLDLAPGQDIADLVGNALPAGEPTTDETYLIDNAAPAAPTALDLATASDLGVSNTDDLTHIPTPTITGTAEAGAKVTLTSSIDGIVGTAIADSAGNWSITTAALMEGVHTFTATASDPLGNTGPASAPLVVTIDLSVPVLTNFNGGATYTEGGSPRIIDGDVQIADAQNDALNGGLGDYAGARFTFARSGGANAEDGYLFSNGRGLSLVGNNITQISTGLAFGTILTPPNGTVSVFFDSSGTAATTALVNAAMQSIAYSNTSDVPPSSVTLDLTFTDSDGNLAVGTTQSVVNITAVNDGPDLTGIAGPQGYIENAAAIQLLPAGMAADIELDALNGGNGNYAGATLVLARSGGANVDDAFSIASGGNLTIAGGPNGGGTISAGGNVIATITDVGDNDELQITFADNGTVPTTALVQEVLRAVFSANASEAPPASVQIAVTLSDGNTGGQGTGGPLDDTETVTVNIAAVNDAPVNTVPGAQATNEDVALVFSAGNFNQLSIADVDAAAGPVSTVLKVASGTLAVTTGGGAAIANDGTSTVTITGTVAQVNAALASVTYSTPLNFNGADTLTLTTNDGGNSGTGGALSDNDTVNITVNPINDAPVNTVPGPQATKEDVALVFSIANGNALSISDIDAGNGIVTTTLTATTGSLTAAAGSGAALAGNGSANLTISGTVARINAALAGLVFAPTNGATGTTTITVTTSDGGNTGGGTLTDTDTITVDVSNSLVSAGNGSGQTNIGQNGTSGQTSNFVDTPGNPIGFNNGVGGQAGGQNGPGGNGGGNPLVDDIITGGIGGNNPFPGEGGINEGDLPGSISLDPASDSGLSNSDNTTRDNTPLLRGVAPANATVTIRSSLGGVLGTAQADANGNWSFISPTLPDGPQELIATPTDEDGKEGIPSLPLLATIDTVAPDTPPAPAFDGDIDQLRSNDTPIFKGTAEPGARIVLTSGTDGVIGEAIADENGNWSVTTGPLSQNVHSLGVTATDAAGNASQSSAALDITVRGAEDTTWNLDGSDALQPAASSAFREVDLAVILSGFTGSRDAGAELAAGSKGDIRSAAIGFTRQMQMAGNSPLFAANHAA